VSSLPRGLAVVATAALVTLGAVAVGTGSPQTGAVPAAAPAPSPGGASTSVAAAVETLLHPGTPGCAPSRLTRYVASLLRGLSPAQLRFLLTSDVLDLPAAEAALFGRAADPAFAATPAARPGLERALRDSRASWGPDAPDVEVLAVHGGLLRDPVRLTRLLVVREGLAPREAAVRARTLVAAVAAVPALRGGDNPVFTLGAAAVPARAGTGGHPRVPARVLVGDGLLAFLAGIGVADVGAQVVVGQQVADLLPHRGRTSPVAAGGTSRRRDLRAAALGSYAVVSAAGPALDVWRVVQVTGAIAEVGACRGGREDAGAAPEDQRRAAWWGAVAAEGELPGTRPAPRWLEARFDAALPGLLPPRAPASGTTPPRVAPVPTSSGG